MNDERQDLLSLAYRECRAALVITREMTVDNEGAQTHLARGWYAVACFDAVARNEATPTSDKLFTTFRNVFADDLQHGDEQSADLLGKIIERELGRDPLKDLRIPREQMLYQCVLLEKALHRRFTEVERQASHDDHRDNKLSDHFSTPSPDSPSKINIWLACTIAIVCSLASIILAFLDSGFRFRWLTVFLWITSLVVFSIGLIRPDEIIRFFRLHKRNEHIAFAGVAITALVTRLTFLGSIPFNAIGDQTRDCGLVARGIALGEIRNLFDWGPYNSFGLTTAGFCAALYPVFGDSLYIFRLPAGIFSSFSIILLFFLVRRVAGLWAATCAGLVLTFNLFDFFFGRTETVLALNGLCTTIALLACWALSRERTARIYAIIGMISGIALTFHAGTRPVLFFVATAALILCGIDAIRKKIAVQHAVAMVACLVVFTFIGLGPKIIFTNFSDLLVAGNRVSFSSPTVLFSKYVDSILVFFHSPMSTLHFLDGEPIFAWPALILLVAGVALSLFSKSRFFTVVSLILLSGLPLTNSAITDSLNADHRLTPLVVVGCLFVGFALLPPDRRRVPLKFAQLHNRLSGKWIYWQTFAGFICLVLALASIIRGVTKEPFSYSTWNRDAPVLDFLSTYGARTLKESPLANRDVICVGLSEKSAEVFERMHTREYFEFLVPHKKFVVLRRKSAKDQEMYLAPDCLDFDRKPWARRDFCIFYEKFLCPPNRESLSIYISI